MNQLKKTVVSVLAVVSVGVLCAGEFTWTGAAGDNDWSNGANWGGTAPGATDTAIFTKAATVTPPATFTGLMRVNGDGCLTVDVPSDRNISLALGTDDCRSTGASFKKTGAGKLVLHAHAGINPGTVTIAEGSIEFAGNGDEAAGAFDAVVLESGVSATVVDSPVEKRHGYAFHVVKGGTIDYESFYTRTTVSQLAQYYDGWQFAADGETRYAGVQTVPENASAFDVDGMPVLPFVDDTLLNKSGVLFYYRGIFISETAEPKYWGVAQTTGNGAAMVIAVNSTMTYREWKKPGDGFRTWPVQPAIKRGWASLLYGSANDLRYWGSVVRGYTFYLKHSAFYDGDSGAFTGAKLWNGVCFNSIEVKSGASLSVGDGQAVAIANARALKVNGRFSGSDKAYLLLASDWSAVGGDEKLSATALRGFSGTVEIGSTSAVGGETSSEPVPYTLVGSGEVCVTEANKDKLGQFEGSFVVADGVSFDFEESGDGTSMAEKAALRPLNSDTWQFVGGAVQTGGDNAVQLLKRASGKGQWDKVTERSAIVGKAGIPVYCPFELTCDVWMRSSSAPTISTADPQLAFCVHAAGPSMTFADRNTNLLGYMLPSTSIPFGFAVSSYNLAFSWLTGCASNDPYAETLGSNSWAAKSDKKLPYRLAYDGKGTFTATFSTDGVKDMTYQRTYPVLAESRYAETTLYPMISARGEFGNYGTIFVSNVSFKVLSGPHIVARRLTLGDNATLNVKTGQVDAEAGTPALGFASLTMGAGATLNCAPYFSGLVTGVSLDGVMVCDGAATVVPAANESMTTTVGDFTSRNGGKLTVTGPVTVKTPLTVSVSRTELKAAKGPVTLLDASGALPVPAIDLSDVTLNDLDASGKRIGLEYVNGLLKANASFGLFLVVE